MCPSREKWLLLEYFPASPDHDCFFPPIWNDPALLFFSPAAALDLLDAAQMLAGLATFPRDEWIHKLIGKTNHPH